MSECLNGQSAVLIFLDWDPAGKKVDDFFLWARMCGVTVCAVVYREKSMHGGSLEYGN